MGIPWIRRHGITIKAKENEVLFNSQVCRTYCSLTGKNCVPKAISIEPPEKQYTKISAVGVNKFRRAMKGKDSQVFMLYLHEILTKDPGELVPRKWPKRLHMFEEAEASSLPPHRSHDYPIDLREGEQIPWFPMYGMTREELKALREYLDENLVKGFIRTSLNPAGAPVLFVKKADGRLRLCVDYRKLNAITIKNRHPLPLTPETLVGLAKAKWFTKLDLKQGYYQIRIREGDE